MKRLPAVVAIAPSLALAAVFALAAGGARAAEPVGAAVGPAPAASAPATGASAPSTGLGEPRKVPTESIDYATPALEIVGFDFLLNRFSRYFGTGREDYAVSLSSIRRNLRSGWGTDRDPFNINQLGHPYQGSMYHGFARSAGFNYWESAGYAFAGSAFWEIFGEQTRPSRNDQVASGIGGTFLGEALFRMSNLVLEHGGGMPRAWREIAAAAISPSTGFNRLVFSDRYGAVFSSKDAAYYSRLRRRLQPQHPRGSRRHLDQVPAERSAARLLDRLRPARQEEVRVHAAVRLLQLPGDGVERQRLRERAHARPARRQELRGRPRLPRRLGPLRQLRLHLAADLPRLGDGAVARHDRPPLDDARPLARGHGLVGVGYTAVGTAHGAASDRDYNYGVTPQALLALRLTHSDKASLDVTGREYFVSRVASGTTGGHDNIVRLDAALTVRVYRAARAVAALSRQPPRRELRRRADRPPGAQHGRRLLHAARPGPLRHRRLALNGAPASQRTSRPCARCRRRSQRAARLSSWVTRTNAMRAPARQLEHQREHAVGGDAVEVAGRLVGEHAVRVAGERAGDRDALALAARKLRRPMRQPLGRGRPGRARRRHARAPPRCATRRMRSGMATLSSAVNSGSRWWNW